MSHRRQSSISGSDLNAALASLSSCSRCRRRRIKCDNRLPACIACDKANAACEYADHLLGRDVSRAYLASLVRRADELDILKASTAIHQTNAAPAQAAQEVPVTPLAIGVHSKTGYFWGPCSLYDELRTHLHAQGKVPHVPKLGPGLLSDVIGSLSSPVYEHVTLPDLEACDKLFNMYHASVETTYPVLGRLRASTLLGIVFNNSSQGDRESSEASSRCLLMLVLSISFQLLGQTDVRAHSHAKKYFSASQQEDILKTNGSISERIEYLLLTCIFSLMNAKDDHIWSLLSLTNQICVENYPFLEKSGKLHLYSTFLILDVEVAATYGRPTNVPDNTIRLSADHFRDFPVLTYHMFRLGKIQSRIHSLAVKATDDRQPFDSSISLLREELNEWMSEWNMTRSNMSPSSISDPGFHLLMGTLLFDLTLLRLLDLSSTTSHGWEERQEVAARFIRSCYAIYFEPLPQESEREHETSERNSEHIFPFFWTHTHSLFKAALTVHQKDTSYSGLSTEDIVTLDKALALLIRFDHSRKLVDASMSLRAS